MALYGSHDLPHLLDLHHFDAILFAILFAAFWPFFPDVV